MNKRVALIVGLAFTSIISCLWGGEIRFNGEQQEIQLFNSSNNKIMNYIIVEPQEKVRFQAIGVDSLVVYSRILGKEEIVYNYLAEIDNVEKTVTRTAKKSKVTKTLSGISVSAYNSLKLMVNGHKEITLTNNWGNDIFFKVVASKNERDYDNYEYVRFSPQYYENEIAVNISDKDYTYYQVDHSNIAFELEGPVLVKIISRLIFEDNLQTNMGYEYTVYDNGEELASFYETAQHSGKAFFPDLPNKTPSTGDVNIVQLSAGKHRIDVKDGILNRNLIFRFYINKSSIGITEK